MLGDQIGIKYSQSWKMRKGAKWQYFIVGIQTLPKHSDKNARNLALISERKCSKSFIQYSNFWILNVNECKECHLKLLSIYCIPILFTEDNDCDKNTNLQILTIMYFDDIYDHAH